MSVAVALEILSAVATLLDAIKELPGAIKATRALLEEVRSYATELGVDVATEFTALDQRLHALGG